MTSNTTPTNAPTRAAVRHARPGLAALSEGIDAKAGRRRTGLRVVLARHGLTPTLLAQHLGMATANRFYNFLNGHAASLSLDTIEAILVLLPDTSFEELVGWGGRQAPAPGIEEF